MIKATFIRDLDNFRDKAKLYRLSEPVPYDDCHATDYVAVSAVQAVFDTGGQETYIFPTDENGKVVDWGEMEGSSRGHIDHDRAIADAGWELVP